MSFGLGVSFGRLVKQSGELPPQVVIYDTYGNIDYVITKEGKTTDRIEDGDSVWFVEDGHVSYGYNKRA